MKEIQPSSNYTTNQCYNASSEITLPFERQWSIRQANSRLQAYGLQTALENDLNCQVLREKEKQVQGSAIPLDNLNGSTESQFSSNNPYLSGTAMIQQPSRSPAYRNPKHKTYGFQDPFAEAPMEAWQEIKDYNLRVNGLPTLDQMMRLHTYSPLTQSNFATFLRRRNVHQNLNFLMELETHDKLWRAYLQSIDRQNRQRLSRFLESAAEKEPYYQNNSLPTSPSGIISSSMAYLETSDTEDLLTALPPLPLTPRSYNSQVEYYASRGDASLNRHDLIQNATRIYRTYCSPLNDAAQTIHLPDDHRRALEELVENNKRPEPIVYDSARSHVFEILNVFYYPLFVDDVLHKNISIGTSRLFLGLGMIILILGFSLELSSIFLDTGTIYLRWIASLPFFIGWSLLITSLTDFSWWFGIFSINEIQFMIYSEIQDITVKRLHRKRGWICLILILFSSLITTVIFVFIPSHRL
ncbi:uncharacterized protein BX663DRAFT_502440 [Cokeromyces recurvatus]|uniref:uncharacterized protein n=1 Tax=Cokeromyces recurvatus TaxID=90255 RepID=UPI0022211897|nr:uncharacterized protein BX663DRAFT_502440 [Cokeromyces recurvatus]KAI7905321.1 hypothetical protein BX663DRAFT_502440 [Cokeromyces recurvatus]